MCTRGTFILQVFSLFVFLFFPPALCLHRSESRLQLVPSLSQHVSEGCVRRTKKIGRLLLLCWRYLLDSVKDATHLLLSDYITLYLHCLFSLENGLFCLLFGDHTRKAEDHLINCSPLILILTLTHTLPFFFPFSLLFCQTAGSTAYLEGCVSFFEPLLPLGRCSPVLMTPNGHHVVGRHPTFHFLYFVLF